jgi:hypothetical protein
MPLAPASSLKSALLDMTTNFPASPAAAAQIFMDAYASFAQGALSCGGGTPIPADFAARKAAAVAALAAGGPTTIPTALVSFWTAMTFSSLPPAAPGAALPPTGTAALTAALTAITPGTDADGAIGQVASALDAFTKTVAVLHPLIPAGACSLPIT